MLQRGQLADQQQVGHDPKENFHNLEVSKSKLTYLELKTNKPTNKRALSPLLPLRSNSTYRSPPRTFLSLRLFFSVSLSLSPLSFLFLLPSDGSSVSGILESTWTPSVLNPAHRDGKTERPGGCRRASPNCDQMFPLRAARERRAAPNIFRHIRVPCWLAGWLAVPTGRALWIRDGPDRTTRC